MNLCKNEWCMHEAGVSGYCENCLVHHGNPSTRLDIATPAPLIQFRDSTNEVGRLTIKDGALHFEGDADESAKVFIRAMGAHLNLPVQLP